MTLLLAVGVSLFCVWFFWLRPGSAELLSPVSDDNEAEMVEATPKPLLRYSFDNLAQEKFVPGVIVLDKTLTTDESEKFSSYLFLYDFEGKTVSGKINIPKAIPAEEGFPVILMLRGYVDEAVYETGIGTDKAAAFFATNGYITLAPDFLGFGDSDAAHEDIWQDRFSRPAQVLQLLKSIGSLNQVDETKIGLWAHSNGGQIALSILEITRAEYPTSLWAPVSKPFPYSVLYYTDEFDDQGQYLRKELARFEAEYEVFDYSIGSYLDQIEAPIQVHQGTADDAVPVEWSEELAVVLEEVEVEVELFIYNGADHNLDGSWNRVVARDLVFYDEWLGLKP